MATREAIATEIVVEHGLAFEPGVWCEKCNKRLVELKRQTLKLILPELNNVIQYEGSLHRGSRLATRIFDQLHVPDTEVKTWQDNRCDVCSTNVTQLKNEALSMVQTLEDSRLLAAHIPRISTSLPDEASSQRPLTTPLTAAESSYNHSVNFPPRYGYMAYGHDPTPIQQVPLSVFARAAYKLRKKQKKAVERSQKQTEMTATNPTHTNSSGNVSPEPSVFPTNFCNAVRRYPPPSPPGLIKGLTKRKSTGGKVKVLLRICPSFPGETSSFLKVDQKKKQVTLYDPNAVGHVSQKYRRMGVAAPKMFAFDSIFEPDTSQVEICSTALTDVLQSVVNGSDGCVFSYGHSGLGKTFTMIGRDETTHGLGIIACSIAWLFRLIDEKREKTGARFSIRVSAVEVVGRSENLRDLLHEQSSADSNDATQGTKPSVYLYDDPISGPQLLNHSELRASTPEKAAFYLDAALTSRTTPNNEKDSEETLNSHMFFTVHVYQSRVDKIAGKMGVHGGRSRLHLIDLASCERFSATKKETSCSSMSLNGLGNVIIALINGAKHVPHKDSTLTRLLRESLGTTTCRATMIGHISPSIPFYTESLSCVQFAARIHRLRRKKGGKGSSTSSSGGDSSCDEMRMRKPRIRTSALSESLQEGCSGTSDYTSSTGEESCDTVIYVGPDGELSDRELTDNEGPSHMTKVPGGSEGIKVNGTLKTKLAALEEAPNGRRCESMELEYDLTEEFKGNIEKVPEKGSVENLTLAKKKKKVSGNEYCEFWEDPLCAKTSPTREDCPKIPEEFTTETAVPEDIEMECIAGSRNEGFVPIKEISSSSEYDLTSGAKMDEEDLSHSPALDTPLSTFYHLVPDPSLNESEGQEKSPSSETPEQHHVTQSNLTRAIPSAPPSPTSKEVRSILENYVADQMLIKNSSNQQQANYVHHDIDDGCFVPPLMPKKTCVSGTAQISATSPKRKLPGKTRELKLASGDRQCFSDVGDNRSDTQSEDSYGSTKTDPLHYIKPPRRGVKPSSVNAGSLPREYKVIIRNKTSRVRYLGCESETERNKQSCSSPQRSPSKPAPVQLKYCGFEENEECESHSRSSKSPSSPTEESSKCTPLTITSRATYAFNLATAKKPVIENENIKTGEPYGSHGEVSKNNKENLISKTDGETPVNSENDSPKLVNNRLGVPRQRSKLRVSRRRDSGHGYSSGIASDGSMTDSPTSKSPARRRRRWGSTKSEVSSSGYESMRDGGGTTSHVSGSDTASEKGVRMDYCRSSAETRQMCTSSQRESRVDEFDCLRLGGIEELRESPTGCASGSLLDIHKWRIVKLRTKQVELRKELDKAKGRLLLEGTRWSFYLESQNMNLDDPDLAQVLETENKRLERRIHVCKSRVMLVTSFDILPQRSKL